MRRCKESRQHSLVFSSVNTSLKNFLFLFKCTLSAPCGMEERKCDLKSYNCDLVTVLNKITPLHLPWEPHLPHL